MIEFKSYESKPTTREAFQLTDKHEWFPSPAAGESTWLVAEKVEETTNIIRFKAYQQPVVGDWVVRLTHEDTYHCTDAVFRERNIVPAGE